MVRAGLHPLAIFEVNLRRASLCRRRGSVNDFNDSLKGVVSWCLLSSRSIQ